MLPGFASPSFVDVDIRTRERVPYPFDALPADEPLDPDAPREFAEWEGRPVVIARRDPRFTGGRARVSVPISVSRMRRAMDIMADRATGPYVPSLVDYAPLASADWPRRIT